MSGDALVSGFDRLLRTMLGVNVGTRKYPAQGEVPQLTDAERRHSMGLMRVNHSGEVCAQALYLGQALAARHPELAVSLRESADEEVDHLDWTSRRLRELGGRRSLLDPAWLAGSLIMGASIAVLGDKWSLAFLKETELQVVSHLERHLSVLPAADSRSREVVVAMRDDEAKHALTAQRLGALELPSWACEAMRAASRVMTRLSYRV